MKRQADIRIGISGWRYKGWRGVFYPAKLPQRQELEYAASKFNTVELNGSFYSLQRPESFVRWYDETPPGFIFAVKGSRFITHMLKLTRAQTPLANFFAQGVLRLRDKLGPILWQFPPNFHFNADRLTEFFELLPRTHREAAKLVRYHAELPPERTWANVRTDYPLRHCIEIRHESFACEEAIRLLREHRIGLVVADTVEWPLLFDVTADFVYCRLHGSEELYVSGYESHALQVWAERIRQWSQGKDCEGRKASSKKASTCAARDVYVYFDNDAKVRAPFDALALADIVT